MPTPGPPQPGESGSLLRLRHTEGGETPDLVEVCQNQGDLPLNELAVDAHTSASRRLRLVSAPILRYGRKSWQR